MATLHSDSPAVAQTPDSRGSPHEITPEKLEASQYDNVDLAEKPLPPIEFTEEEKNRVIRKLDWRLMPLIFVLYSLSVLDRSNLGNARLAGLAKSINITGRRYDWLATVFYIACRHS